MLSGRLTFELSVFLTSKGILCCTKNLLCKELILLRYREKLAADLWSDGGKTSIFHLLNLFELELIFFF